MPYHAQQEFSLTNARPLRSYYDGQMLGPPVYLINIQKHYWAPTCCVPFCMEPQQCWHLLAFVAYSLKPVKLPGGGGYSLYSDDRDDRHIF